MSDAPPEAAPGRGGRGGRGSDGGPPKKGGRGGRGRGDHEAPGDEDYVDPDEQERRARRAERFGGGKGKGGAKPAPAEAAGGSTAAVSESALAVLIERLHEGLQPPANLSERDEAVRVRMERCLRGRWPDVSVGIYGSAGSGLRVGASSDVDLCAFFPKVRARARARVS